MTSGLAVAGEDVLLLSSTPPPLSSRYENKKDEDRSSYRSVLDGLRACTPTPAGPARMLYFDTKHFLEREGADVPVIAARLCGEAGYDATVKEKKRGGETRGLFDVSHEYVQVRLEGSAVVVVEVRLREHFALPRESPRYKEVLRRVPEIFVGSRAQLRSLVGIMCAEMATNLTETGLSVPPWRKFDSVWSRWANTPEEDQEERSAAVTYAARRDDVGAFAGTWAEMIREREVREHIERMASHAAAEANRA